VTVGHAGFHLSKRGFVVGRNGPKTLSDWKEFCNAEGDSSLEAATTVLNVLRKPSELRPRDIQPRAFSLGHDRSASSFGAHLSQANAASNSEQVYRRARLPHRCAVETLHDATRRVNKRHQRISRSRVGLGFCARSRDLHAALPIPSLVYGTPNSTCSVWHS
jgi:hypothetical protein